MAEENVDVMERENEAAEQHEEPTGSQQQSGEHDKIDAVEGTEKAAKKADLDNQSSTPPWWKPDLFRLKYRGQTVSPRDYNHAVQLMQQGWSYSQAMEAVNRQRSELEQRSRQYQQYEALDQAFRQNPQFAQKIWQMYEEAKGGGQASQDHQADPRWQQLYQTVQAMQQRLQSWDAEKADAEVRQEMDDLRKSFPGVQWDQTTESGHTLMWDVLKHAHDNGFPSLKAAARDYLWDTQVASAKMQGAESVAEAKRKAARAGIVQSGQGAPANADKTVNLRNTSYDDLTRMALDSLGVKRRE